MTSTSRTVHDDARAAPAAAATTQRVEVVVFWLDDGRAEHRRFVTAADGTDLGAGAEVVSDPLAAALAWCEALRRRTADGAGVAHVCLSTQVAGDATRRGVSDERPAGYDWTKRRRAGPMGRR